jgi:hypothetical protein
MPVWGMFVQDLLGVSLRQSVLRSGQSIVRCVKADPFAQT